MQASTMYNVPPLGGYSGERIALQLQESPRGEGSLSLRIGSLSKDDGDGNDNVAK